MASFPNSPVDGQLFTLNNVNYKYSSSNKAWVKNNDSAYLGMSTYDRSIYKTLSTSTVDKTIYDTDLNIEMRYFFNGLGNYIQNEGQIETLTTFPSTPTNGTVFIGSEGTVYSYDATKDYWDVVLKEYIRKHTPSQGSYVSHRLNDSELRIHRDTSDNMWISVYQDTGMDSIIYSLDDSTPTRIVLGLNTEQTLVDSNINKGVEHILTTELVHDGNGQSVVFVRYENTIFVIRESKILIGDTTFSSMTNAERILYANDTTKTLKRFVLDTDLGMLMQFLPNGGNVGSFVEYRGQTESGNFPYSSLTDGTTFSSNGKAYTYDSAKCCWLYSGEAPLKNNMDATAMPTVNDDVSKGYSQGSVWVYNSVVYTCQDATKTKAKWVSSADIFYFDTWTAMITAISVEGSNYLNKYCNVTNANGGNGSGTTYINGGTLSSKIVDGGQATYYVNVQGSSYSVACLKRAVTNPILVKVLTSSDSGLPTIAGYYTSDNTYTGTLVSGTSKGDIIYYDGSTWSLFQTYASAPSTILVGSTQANQFLWIKQQGSWIIGGGLNLAFGNYTSNAGTTGLGGGVFKGTASNCVSSNVNVNATQATMTIKANGIYRVFASCRYGSNGAIRAGSAVYKNGVILLDPGMIYIPRSGQGGSSSAEGIFTLTAGDVIEVRLTGADGTGTNCSFTIEQKV